MHWKEQDIIQRADGSFVIQLHGAAYHVPENVEEFAELWAEVSAHVAEHPERLAQEPVPAPPTVEELAARVRQERDARIAATDYLMAADYPLSDASRAAVAGYRQALRDLPQAEGFPWDGGDGVPWPVVPE